MKRFFTIQSLIRASVLIPLISMVSLSGSQDVFAASISPPPPPTFIPPPPPPLITPSSTPYFTTPISIPGMVRAEFFDKGGEGVAYHDSDVVNKGGKCRINEAVDLKLATDAGVTGCAIGYTVAGEWVVYSLTAAADGIYTITARTATISTGQSFHLYIDGAPVGTGPIPNPPNQTAWDKSWQTVSVGEMVLKAGSHTMKLIVDTDPQDFFSFAFTRRDPPPPFPAPCNCFTTNDRVLTTTKLNVRDAANGKILGTQLPGSHATVLGTSVDAGGLTWWHLKYDSAPLDGWSVANFLTLDWSPKFPGVVGFLLPNSNLYK